MSIYCTGCFVLYCTVQGQYGVTWWHENYRFVVLSLNTRVYHTCSVCQRLPTWLFFHVFMRKMFSRCSRFDGRRERVAEQRRFFNQRRRRGGWGERKKRFWPRVLKSWPRVEDEVNEKRFWPRDFFQDDESGPVRNNLNAATAGSSNATSGGMNNSGSACSGGVNRFSKIVTRFIESLTSFCNLDLSKVL